jgi:hypothetical protein
MKQRHVISTSVGRLSETVTELHLDNDFVVIINTPQPFGESEIVVLSHKDFEAITKLHKEFVSHNPKLLAQKMLKSS